MDTGDIIDRFEVKDIIGRGGVATVYRLEHRVLGSAHALKVLHSGSSSVRARLLTEARAQATLRHPNLTRVTDLLDVDGDPGLLMEFVDGPSLEELLARARPSLPEALQIFRGVVRGLAHAHHQGWVHRDLKPANILLSRQDDVWVPKICDFGLVKVVMSDVQLSGRTHAGTAMGTPGYMAPEQIRDASAVDHRADMFSLGAVLYELTTGMRAFNGKTVLKVLNRVAKGDYLPPRDYVPELPENVVTLITDLLEINRDDRLPNCDDVLTRLDAIAQSLQGPATIELPSPLHPPAGLPAPVELVALGLIGLALLVALVLPTPTRVLPQMAAGTPEGEMITQPTPANSPQPALPPDTKLLPEPPVPPRPPHTAKPKGATQGRLRITGAKKAWLVLGNKRIPATGPIPPGSYNVLALFAGRNKPYRAGKVKIEAGKTTVLTCDPKRRRCR